MNVFSLIIDFILHIDEYLVDIIDRLGNLTYIILFIIIFLETGLVVTPFLPGDSLLFAAGTLSAIGSLNIFILYITFLIAAIIGDSVNYNIGKKIGPRAFKMNNRFIKKSYLEKTQKFYEKHGGKAIVFARFIPIVRTFAPFVAGIGEMNYSKFITYNVIGGFLWVTIFTFLGYFFGNIPFIKNNFHYAIIIIILLSIIPILYEFIKHKLKK